MATNGDGMHSAGRRLDVPDLHQVLDELTAQIPAGRVATCGALAAALGDVAASRWVGHVRLHHAHGPACPCHRLVRAGGVLGGFIGGDDDDEKIRRLTAEGVSVEAGVVDLERYGFADFRSDRPLERLARLQHRLSARVSTRGGGRRPSLVGGVDVSYSSASEGVAAYALCELPSRRLVWSTTIRRAVRFPYITGYLAFRELPMLLELIDEVRRAGRLAEVLLVDGSGVLHPRSAGVASFLGVLAELRTIGVTKKLLCGQIDPATAERKTADGARYRTVRIDDRTVGAALLPAAKTRKPIYLSPGHRVSPDFALRVGVDLLGGHKLPEPLYWADRLSRQAARGASASVGRR